MKKLSSIGAVVLGALIAALAILGFFTPAQAYPEVSINLTVDRQVIYGGESFTATASSDGTKCTWSLEWDGKVRHGESYTEHDGQSYTRHDFTTTYKAAHVKKTTKIPLHGNCSYSDNARGTATWQETIMITVLPRRTAVSPPTGGGSGTGMPNTGGPNIAFLIGGLVLLLSGATAVTVARRRAEEAELQASRA
jgi:LPXTG-motif cell wall-anchored protein